MAATAGLKPSTLSSFAPPSSSSSASSSSSSLRQTSTSLLRLRPLRPRFRRANNNRNNPTPPSASLFSRIKSALPDLGRPARQRVLDDFYNADTAKKQVELLSDDFVLREEGSSKSFNKRQYEATITAAYESVPDWNWTHGTDAIVDSQGFAVVFLQPTGHFTGKPYAAPSHPGWPALQPDGRRFALAPETVKVRVDGGSGKIKEIVTLPVRGAGPRGLYEALGGEVPK